MPVPWFESDRESRGLASNPVSRVASREPPSRTCLQSIGDLGADAWQRSVDRADQRLAVLADRHPAPGMRGRLALEVAIAGGVPRLHGVVEVIEDVVTLVGAHGQHRMAL